MGKINIQHIRIDRIFKTVQHSNGADFRSEHKSFLAEAIIERFFSHSITQKKHLPLFLIV